VKAAANPAARSPGGRLSFAGLVAFSLPGVPIGALVVALGVYLPPFYAGRFGLGVSAVGLAFMTVRLIDMTFDPIIGVVMDRTRLRLGRYRVWLAGGAPVLMLGVYSLFAPPAGAGYGYLVAWLFVYYIGVSLVSLAHAAWASVVAGPYHERSRVFGAIQITSILGATAVLILPIALAAVSGRSGASDVTAMGWFIVLATPICTAAAIARTPERAPKSAKGARVGLGEYWAAITQPDMLRITAAEFCLTLGPGWMSAIYLFFFRDVRGFTIAQASLLLLIYAVAGAAGAAGLSWLATKIGKHRALIGAAVGYSLGLVGLAFMPKVAFWLIAPFMFAMGFLATGFSLLDRAMTADVGDVVRLEQGKDRVGLLYSLLTTSGKVASALSIGLSYVVLGWIGYRPSEHAANTAAAIEGLKWVFLLGPIVFVMLGAACYIGYTLDSRRHDEVRAALGERDRMEAG
jgi:Na+/melibiose symporter-like transporter